VFLSLHSIQVSVIENVIVRGEFLYWAGSFGPGLSGPGRAIWPGPFGSPGMARESRDIQKSPGSADLTAAAGHEPVVFVHFGGWTRSAQAGMIV